ncbi:hypothetical protein PVAND_004385 [Polypedilum vanderplanki]|uniref:Uncharacterized protein n=1 Tax=Polypedilum vanderplanki TaxID=319348 RepID=A0A9J6BXY5_POLVA|nr:hypothetical protein PVAND_004385 [Polypedilum vanderplanki]
MRIYAKIFILIATLSMISALPVESEVNEPQIDLLAAESSVPISENEATDVLTRDKRHHHHHGYYGGYGSYGGYGGYPYGGYGGYSPFGYGGGYGGYGYGGYSLFGYGGGYWASCCNYINIKRIKNRTMSSEEHIEPQQSVDDNEPETPPSEQNPQEVEKQEEEKLKAKYPQAVTGLGRPGGHSAFLQKRLQKGQKYFDSGDYQMAKQKTGIKQIFANKNVPTGEAIPTPESVPVRKTSIIQPCNKQF